MNLLMNMDGAREHIVIAAELRLRLEKQDGNYSETGSWELGMEKSAIQALRLDPSLTSNMRI